MSSTQWGIDPQRAEAEAGTVESDSAEAQHKCVCNHCCLGRWCETLSADPGLGGS